ncbi:hypothetical protein BDW62DRAFT_197491 [Aspergillus aurantiobrunneus]
MWKPFPKFFILRPDGKHVPLIPLDELPSWLQVGFLDWNDPYLYMFMVPATDRIVPREGEYDVICQYCLSSVDNMLHRSASETGNDTRAASPTHYQTSRSLNAMDIAALVPRTVNDDKKNSSSFSYLPGADKSLPLPTPLPLLKQPPFHSVLQRPMVGMCLVRGAQFIWSLLPSMSSRQPLTNHVATENDHAVRPSHPSSERLAEAYLTSTIQNSQNQLDLLGQQTEEGQENQRGPQDKHQLGQQSQQNTLGIPGPPGPPGPHGPRGLRGIPRPASAGESDSDANDADDESDPITNWSPLDTFSAEISVLNECDSETREQLVTSMVYRAYNRGLQDKESARKRVLDIQHTDAQFYSRQPSSTQLTLGLGGFLDRFDSKSGEGALEAPEKPRLQGSGKMFLLGGEDDDGNDNSQKQEDSTDEDENESRRSKAKHFRDPKDPQDPPDPPGPSGSQGSDSSNSKDGQDPRTKQNYDRSQGGSSQQSSKASGSPEQRGRSRYRSESQSLRSTSARGRGFDYLTLKPQTRADSGIQKRSASTPKSAMPRTAANTTLSDNTVVHDALALHQAQITKAVRFDIPLENDAPKACGQQVEWPVFTRNCSDAEKINLKSKTAVH